MNNEQQQEETSEACYMSPFSSFNLVKFFVLCGCGILRQSLGSRARFFRWIFYNNSLINGSHLCVECFVIGGGEALHKNFTYYIGFWIFSMKFEYDPKTNWIL